MKEVTGNQQMKQVKINKRRRYNKKWIMMKNTRNSIEDHN